MLLSPMKRLFFEFEFNSFCQDFISLSEEELGRLDRDLFWSMVH